MARIGPRKGTLFIERVLRLAVTASSLAHSLHVSVPEAEAWAAREPLEGAMVTAGPLREVPDDWRRKTRVLSVSSQDRLGEADLDLLPSLKAVVTRSTGFDHLPVQGMQVRGIKGFHLGGYATQGVVEHTLMLMIALLRRVPEAMASTGGHAQVDGRPAWRRAGLQGRSLPDVTVGVVGTGRVGGALVRLLAGMDGDVVGYDVEPDPRLRGQRGFRYATDMEELLGVSDVLTLHVPLTPATKGMVDSVALARLPGDAVLVNTARGPVVDQGAVSRALASGRLAGYAADVLPGEPDPPDLERFRGSSKVILTPHLGAYDARSLRERYRTAAHVTQWVLDGDEERLRAHAAGPA